MTTVLLPRRSFLLGCSATGLAAGASISGVAADPAETASTLPDLFRPALFPEARAAATDQPLPDDWLQDAFDYESEPQVQEAAFGIALAVAIGILVAFGLKYRGRPVIRYRRRRAYYAGYVPDWLQDDIQYGADDIAADWTAGFLDPITGRPVTRQRVPGARRAVTHIFDEWPSFDDYRPQDPFGHVATCPVCHPVGFRTCNAVQRRSRAWSDLSYVRFRGSRSYRLGSNTASQFHVADFGQMILGRTEIEAWRPFEGQVVGTSFVHDGRLVAQFAADESKLIPLTPWD